MKRFEAIRILSQYLNNNDLIISTTGNISRELFLARHSPQNFYMLGSMGLASSIGLGLALNLPKKRIIVLEGDGSILMNMGSIATIGHFSPKNLIHIILDNEVYESCGSPPSVSKTINLEKVAEAAKYRLVKKIIKENDLRKCIKRFSFNGPLFILIKIEKGRSINKLPRVPYTPEEIKKYFIKFIKKFI
jgi:thiamine pyrophosphate-dependent acetolactate synthase large subunit-like protein